LFEHAPLTNWQRDIIAMLYEEAMYFAPQALTKMANEGWASYGDFSIMARNRWANMSGIVHYARHKMGVLGGKYSMNPYSVGFKLFLHIEDRWNKGRFGTAYDECKDAQKKENWDTKAGLGHEKVFEVRRVHNDVTMIQSFLDQEFVDRYEFYQWRKFPRPDGGVDYRIETRDAKVIKKHLMERYLNGGRPDIRLVDPNFAGKRIFLLEHHGMAERSILPKQDAQCLHCGNFGITSAW
jgi:stage V sporulation protein R